jgi:UDP-N-acetylmuramate: L-alanyl-gamma-D-glutamyl-meso-diaminopimelate ligase
MNKLPKRLHIIGICGVATSAIAIALHKKGVVVSGSDKGFFPPVSTELTRQGINYYAGWHPELMTKDGEPEIIMVGAASGTQNPETAYAEAHNIPCFSFPEILAKYFIRPVSVVCAGTWGKTSSTALLSYIFEYAKKDPTYMIGGISVSHESSAKLGDGNINIFEGDEYKSSPTDIRAKFEHYKPNNVLLSAVEWDHADVYPTISSYFDAFKRLLDNVNNVSGTIVLNADNSGIQKLIKENKFEKTKIVSYGAKKADFLYSNVENTRSGLKFEISKSGQIYKIVSPMLGSFQAENITGCFAMAYNLGLDSKTIIEAISNFKGIKRRLEKRFSGDIDVYDDIAHSADKANSVLSTIRDVYSGKVISVFEPNSGGRARETLHKYDDSFKHADLVLIPRLTKLKISEDDERKAIDGQELCAQISKTHKNCRYIENDEDLVRELIQTAKKGDVVIFMGSHGFRGMIDDYISRLEKQK